MFTSPFSKLKKSQEKKLTIWLIFLLILCIAILKYFDSFLINDVCTGGIISFELAETLETAQAYLNSWDVTAKTAAGMSMGLDFLFPIIYTSFIGLLIHKLNVRNWKNTPYFKVGNILIWSLFFAGICDYVENFGLIKLLLGSIEQFWVSLAYYFASVKFMIILVGIFYILVNFVIFLMKKRD